MEYESAEELGLAKRELRRLRTRRDLVQAVLVIVSRDGLERFSIDALTEVSRISRGTIYTYFPGGREELLRAAYDQIAHDLITATATGSPRHSDWQSRIGHHAEVLFASAAGNIGHFYHVTGPALLPPAGERGSGSHASFDLIREALEEGQSEGRVSPALDAALTATLLVGALREASIGIATQEHDPGRTLAAFTALVGQLSAQRHP